MSNNNLSGWDLLKLLPPNERRSTLGSIKTASKRPLTDRQKRPYGGTAMSVSRLYATGPTRNHVAQKTADITM